MSFENCWVKSLPVASLLHVAIVPDNWRSFIEKKNPHTSFTFSLSWKDLLLFTIKRLTCYKASAAAFTFQGSCEKNDCCPDSWDLGSFTLLFLSLLFFLFFNESHLSVLVVQCTRGRVASEANSLQNDKEKKIVHLPLLMEVAGFQLFTWSTSPIFIFFLKFKRKKLEATH